jgi:SAM-dependent methyltransferase
MVSNGLFIEAPKSLKQRLQQRVIDPLQFQFDVFPGLRYQPLPWVGLRDSNRGSGTTTRWEAMQPVIEASGSRTALDIGCNVGFFCFALAEMGVAAIGVEAAPRELRIATFARRRLQADNVGFLSLQLTPQNTGLLPACDTVLLLSVWHHWVRSFGFDAATRMLRDVWGRAGKVMFFETGENEMPAEYGLPAMTPTPREWLTAYLARTCPESSIEMLAMAKAFAPGGSETVSVAHRHLFVVRR